MATYTALTVQVATTTGILDLDAVMAAANTQAADGFSFVNDGKTVLVIKDAAAGAGDTFTLVGKADEYGRHETAAFLAKAIAAADEAIIGPFPKSLWDQAGGIVAGKFTTAAATTFIVAVKVP